MSSSKYHGRNLRKYRYSQAGRIYLVTFVTKNRIALFTELFLARIVVRSLAKPENVTTVAYVVMPDHVHWLLQPGESTDLSSIVQAAKSVSAHKINRHIGKKGPVWQSGFHDHALRKEEDIYHAAQYIVSNPIRAGLVQSIGDYPHWATIWL